MSQTSDTPATTHNKFVVGLIIFLVIGLASGAFILSFDALHALALASAIDSAIAWLWPIIIDGFIVTATIAIFALRGRGKGTVRYIWAMLILFAFVSVFGNSIHAVNNQNILGVELWIASAVSAAPAVALLLASHFLVIMISSPKKTNEASEKAHAEELHSTPTYSPVPEPKATKSHSLPERSSLPVAQHQTMDQHIVRPSVEQEIYMPPETVEPAHVSPVKEKPVSIDEMVDKLRDNEKFFDIKADEEDTSVAAKIVLPTKNNATVSHKSLVAQPKKEVDDSQSMAAKPTVLSEEQLISWLKTNDRRASYPVIAEALGVSSRTIQRRVRKLKDIYGEDLATL